MIPILFRRNRRLWTPRDLPNLALWLDASDASTIILNGSTVSQWGDKSGNNRHATQEVASNQPLFSLEGFLSFDGINHFLQTNTTISQPSSFTFVTKSTANNNPLMDGSNLSTRNLIRLGSLADNRFYRIFAGTIIDTSFSIPEDALITTTFNAGNSTGFVNGIQRLSGNAGTQSIGQIRIGRDQGGSTSYNGRLYEIVATTSTLSNSDRQKLEGYVTHKPGRINNLANNHPFKNFPPRK